MYKFSYMYKSIITLKGELSKARSYCMTCTLILVVLVAYILIYFSAIILLIKWPTLTVCFESKVACIHLCYLFLFWCE